MLIERIIVGELEVNCYVLALKDNGAAVLIDPGADFEKIKSLLDKKCLKAECVINTHGHIDHIGCDDQFGVPIYVHSLDRSFLIEPKLNMSVSLGYSFRVTSPILELEDGQVIKAAGMEFSVIHVPGHTPGGIALLCECADKKILFSGDSLFYHSIGRSDLPGGDGDVLLSSLRSRILTLPEKTLVYPGHGNYSNIAEEKKHNPYLR